MGLTHISRNGATFGPYDEQRLTELIASGDILHTDYYWREGMDGWRFASELLPARAPIPADSAPATFLGLSIAITVLCCPLTGIPAIIQSAKVKEMIAAGNLPAARSASRTAAFLCLVSVVLMLAIAAWQVSTRG